MTAKPSRHPKCRPSARFAAWVLVALVMLALGAQPALALDYRTTGAVSLTFDDGWANQYLAYQIANPKGIKGTIYMVTKHLTDSRFLSPTKLQTMQLNGWEVGSHTVNHPHLTQLTAADAEWELAESQSILRSYGLRITTFAYPYGEYNDAIVSASKKYYIAARTCRWGLNDFPPTYLLRCKGVDAAKSLDDIKFWIRDAKAQRKWLIILLHDIRPADQATSPHISIDMYKAMIRYLYKSRIPTPTVASVVSQYPPVDGATVTLSPISGR